LSISVGRLFHLLENKAVLILVADKYGKYGTYDKYGSMVMMQNPE